MNFIKYLICPGYVYSANDGEHHFLSFRKLCTLYQVNPNFCLDYTKANHRHGQDLTKLIWLTPKYNGDYTLPN